MKAVRITSPPRAGLDASPSGSRQSPLPAFGSSKIDHRHLERLAIVYVRQSDPHQVLLHRESKELQYNLADRAVSLGWPRERVLIIDEDQGQSATSAASRHGFQRLLAEVALDHVGLVLGFQMSRLARSCTDWHQLLELCARFGTLLTDLDGMYDPADYNDRLLLGLKGTMSEAELHMMCQRMHQGRSNKARRGEFFTNVPIGYVRGDSGQAVMDPDAEVQSVVRLVFEKFDELGSAGSVLRYLVANGIRLGIRRHDGPTRGQLEWRRPSEGTLLNMLHHPMYAGAYSHGRHPTDARRKVPGRRSTGRTTPAMEAWEVLRRDQLPGYITWERFLANQEQLKQNRSLVKSKGVPRKRRRSAGRPLVLSALWLSPGGRLQRLRTTTALQMYAELSAVWIGEMPKPVCSPSRRSDPRANPSGAKASLCGTQPAGCGGDEAGTAAADETAESPFGASAVRSGPGSSTISRGGTGEPFGRPPA